MAIANTKPSLISFKKTVSFTTIDLNTSDLVVEGFTVNGPTSVGVTPVVLAGGTKAVVPLGVSSGAGSPFLKIHFPEASTGDTLYVTYAVSNSLMADGYYDYKTGVPSTYVTALRTWINTNPITGTQYLNGSLITRSRSLKFTTYGASTNQSQKAKTFYIKFQAQFGLASGSASASAGTGFSTL